MSNKAKGDELEDLLFQILAELLSNDQFYLSDKSSKPFKKKGYYSRDRDSDIIFDVTIESYMPEQKDWSFLHIFECKNLNKNVGPDDIEEFSSKIHQIGKHNTRGIMVSKKGFSKSVINQAKNWGMGLIRINNQNHLEWVNYRRKGHNPNLSMDAGEAFLATVNGNLVVNNLADFLLEAKIIDFYLHGDKYLNIPYLSEGNIRKVTEKYYDKFYENDCLNTTKLCEYLESRYDIGFAFENLEEGTLGKINFDPLKIYVDTKQDTNRIRFTLCHEIGHLILHRKWLADRVSFRLDTKTSIFDLGQIVSDKITRRIEIQANIFAANLLLPTEPFVEDVRKYFKEENILKTSLFLDNQPINISLVTKLTNRLSAKYKVSNQAIKIRMISLNLLIDKSNPSLRNILKESFSSN